MRLVALGAFPFPLPQGSQVYARDQLRALRGAGAEATLLCYGRGAGPAPADLPTLRIAPGLSPRALRAGPALGKPVADAALVAALLSAQRRAPFDAVLAHNAEAALAALAARVWTRTPVVYVAHTLLEQELPHYGPGWARRALARLGRRLDRQLATASDAVLALSRAGEQGLRAWARGPLERIPPGLDPLPAPDPAQRREARRRHGLGDRPYVVYAGNLDGYQGLDELAAAARRRPERTHLVVTYGQGRPEPPLRAVRVSAEDEARALLHEAAVAVLPRRARGGFPIKLLNYMEAGLPIVARRELADGLLHDRSGWLLDAAAGPGALAEAIDRLFTDAPRAARLGRAARQQLEAGHAWPELAERSLRLVARAIERRAAASDGGRSRDRSDARSAGSRGA